MTLQQKGHLMEKISEVPKHPMPKPLTQDYQTVKQD